MNIFYSTGMRSLTYGGFERLIVKLAQKLSSRGHRLIIQYEELPSDRTFMQDLQKALADVAVINTKKTPWKGLWAFFTYTKTESTRSS